MLPETGLFMPVSVGNRRKEQRPGWGIRASVREELGGATRLHPAFKGRRSYAKLFLEGGREMAGVGIADRPPPS